MKHICFFRVNCSDHWCMEYLTLCISPMLTFCCCRADVSMVYVLYFMIKYIHSSFYLCQTTRQNDKKVFVLHIFSLQIAVCGPNYFSFIISFSVWEVLISVRDGLRVYTNNGRRLWCFRQFLFFIVDSSERRTYMKVTWLISVDLFLFTKWK